jgi:hypothetical protein
MSIDEVHELYRSNFVAARDALRPEQVQRALTLAAEQTKRQVGSDAWRRYRAWSAPSPGRRSDAKVARGAVGRVPRKLRTVPATPTD